MQLYLRVTDGPCIAVPASIVLRLPTHGCWSQPDALVASRGVMFSFATANCACLLCNVLADVNWCAPGVLVRRGVPAEGVPLLLP